MTTLGDFNRWGEELETRLQLRTSPIAIKMLEKETDIPQEAKRPRKDFGFHLSLCQAFAKSRREELTVAMVKEDHWCYVPVIAQGLAKPPDFYLEGNTDFPLRVADLEAARNLAKQSPRLECGKYIGVVSAPLKTATFVPDLAVTYCNSAQLRGLLMALKYKKGEIVTTTLNPGGACVQCTVPTLLGGRCQVTIPCPGDSRRALAGDDELIFSVPAGQLEDLLAGVRHLDNTGVGYRQFAPEIRPDYPQPEIYVKLGKMVGLDMNE
jgi:uncharacterized protein (DUF169 family)